MPLLSSADIFTITFFSKKKKHFKKHYQSVTRFGSRSGPTFGRRSVGPDRGSNCWERLSANHKDRR